MNTTSLFNFRFTDDAHAIAITATAFQRSNGEVVCSVSHLSTLREREWTVTKWDTVDQALAHARSLLDVERKVLLHYLSY